MKQYPSVVILPCSPSRFSAQVLSFLIPKSVSSRKRPTRDISKKEIIFRDVPVWSGPKNTEKRYPSECGAACRRESVYNSGGSYALRPGQVTFEFNNPLQTPWIRSFWSLKKSLMDPSMRGLISTAVMKFEPGERVGVARATDAETKPKQRRLRWGKLSCEKPA